MAWTTSDHICGREFTLITDCSALIWLFKSQNLTPKLHRWALRMMEYDMVLKLRPGTAHQLPGALSWLPYPSVPGQDIYDCFPDDQMEEQPGDKRARVLTLDDFLLQTLPTGYTRG